MSGRPYIGGLTRSPVGGGATGPPVARRRGDRPPWRAHWPVAPGVGDKGLSPVGGATGPLLFFYSRDFVANLKKKITFEPYRPPHKATGVYF